MSPPIKSGNNGGILDVKLGGMLLQQDVIFLCIVDEKIIRLQMGYLGLLKGIKRNVVKSIVV